MGKNASHPGLVQHRMAEKERAQFVERPPFPRALNVELSNVCNHSCQFCAYTLMEREHGSMDVAKLEKWLVEAHRLGARDLGLHSGAEPFASRYLEHFTAYAKQVGYEYVYISTNGSLAVPARMKKVIDAGIDSIKFSINAGDRETYKRVHGKDDFDKVMSHVRYASEYRGDRAKPYLAVSFVETEANRHTVEPLRIALDPLVDEFLSFPALNQSGQLAGNGERAWDEAKTCPIPFNKVHISWEGFVRGCCNDYENLLALEDINEMSLEEAYYSERYQSWRKQHLENQLQGTLCQNCKYDTQTPVQPLNPELYFRSHDSDRGPKVSHSITIHRK